MRVSWMNHVSGILHTAQAKGHPEFQSGACGMQSSPSLFQSVSLSFLHAAPSTFFLLAS